MLESRNFYIETNANVKDYMLDVFEKHSDVRKVKAALSEIGSGRLSTTHIKEALVMSYVDSGESEKALELAHSFNAVDPNANMHNLILKTLLSSWGFTQAIFLEESKSWASKYAYESNLALSSHRNERPRIGLVCDYGSTVFGENAIFPMALGLSKSGFDVYYYNFEKATISCDIEHLSCLNVHDKTSEQLSNLIKSNRIDILVDLNGRLREHHRLGVFARRSAPIQINYFNLVGTMGMSNYDYVIADEVQVAEQDDQYYVEKVLRLPCGVNGAFSFKRDVPIGFPESASGRVFTFASFNAFFKCNTLLLQTWAEILSRVPNSRLVIKCHETSRDRVIRKIASTFTRAGVDLSRIMIEGWSSLNALRKQYAHVDLCLDTFPYSGGSSTLNALWQGVPVLTWAGDGWRARSSASMMMASGLTEFIVGSRQEYIEKAVELAINRHSAAEARHYLANNVTENLYFNPEVVYQDLAKCLLGLLE